MKRLTLKINCEETVLEKEVLKLPYKNIVFKDFFIYPSQRTSSPQQLLKLLNKENIELFSIDLFSEELPISDALTKMINLSELVIEGLVIDTRKPIILPTLKILKLSHKSLSLLAFIRANELKSLILRAWSDKWQFYLNGFETLIGISTKIKNLTLNGLPEMPVLNPKVHLASLELNNVKLIDQSVLATFESQKMSLNYLKLDAANMHVEVSDYVYHQLKLKTLVDYCLVRGSFEDPKGVAIENLELKAEQEKIDFIQSLFTRCDFLDTLTINLPKAIEGEILNLVSELPKLRKLKITEWSFDGDIEAGLTFYQLEKLILPSRRKIKGFFSCPKLKYLELRATSSSTDLHEIMNKIPNCAGLNLGEVYNLNVEMLEMLKLVAAVVNIKCEVSNSDCFKKISELKNGIAVKLRYFDPYEGDNNY